MRPGSRHAIHRPLAMLLGVVVALFMLAPLAFAAEEMAHTGRVLISTGGDVTLPAGEQADVVLVASGTAHIAGDANTVVIIDGGADLTGATVETIVVVRGDVVVDGSSSVLGDVMTFDATTSIDPAAVIGGQIRDLAPDIAGIGFVLGPALVLLYVGFALASIAAAVLLAGLAARQVRRAEMLIRREPVLTAGVGILGLVVPIVLLVVLTATIIGAPLAFGIAFGLWPLAAFLGYLVAGIAIGDWILGRLSPAVTRERPYLAAVVGVVTLEVIGIVPLVSAIATLFGYGAVVLLAWRTLRSSTTGSPVRISQVAPAASAG
jgi:hypothetical protein